VKCELEPTGKEFQRTWILNALFASAAIVLSHEMNIWVDRMTAFLRDYVGKTALKRKSTTENHHQSAPIRISRSRLCSLTIWAEGLRSCFIFLLLSL
jgi:hypothetical protein